MRRPNYAHRIAKEHNGILPYHEVFYIRSILFSSGNALSAFARYRESLMRKADETRTADIIFSLQEALGHCAATSRYFWPSSDEKLALARGKNLCRVFQLEETDPLFAVRHIRNVFEHYDEKLDRFCARDPVGQIFDLIVESRTLAEAEVTHVLRLVDPSSQTVVLFGHAFSFGGLETSIQKIHDLAVSVDGNGGRLVPLKSKDE